MASFIEMLSGSLHNLGERARMTDPSYVEAKQRAEILRQQEIEQRKRAMTIDYITTGRMVQAGMNDAALRLLDNRLALGKSLPSMPELGGDFSDTQAMRDAIAKGDTQSIINELPAFEMRAQMQYPDMFGKQNDSPAQFSGQNIMTDGKGMFMVTGINDPNTGTVSPSVVAVDGSGRQPEGPLQMVNNIGLTAGQIPYQKGQEAYAQADARGERGAAWAGPQAQNAAAGTQRGEMGFDGGPSKGDVAASVEDQKAASTRAQDAINSGLDAAKSIPTLSRALNLMDTIETGGIDTFQANAKKWFGVESPDQAELTNLVGKAVIAQLRPTFGAQFTKAEGDWLKAMEAGWGVSTKGNKRLLKQGLKLAGKRTDIGQQQALSRKDQGAFDQMEQYRNFSFDGATPAQPGAAPAEQRNITVDW